VTNTYFNVGADNHAQQASIDGLRYQTVFRTDEAVFTSVQERHIRQSEK